jgi:hypothetical protein
MSDSWRSFHIEGKQHWFPIEDQNIFSITEKDYFNKHTEKINIVDTFECDDRGKMLSGNNKILFIQIVYIIANYFGDRSGRHKRTKSFVLYNDKIYNDKGEEIKKLTKEVERALNEYRSV